MWWARDAANSRRRATAPRGKPRAIDSAHCRWPELCNPAATTAVRNLIIPPRRQNTRPSHIRLQPPRAWNYASNRRNSPPTAHSVHHQAATFHGWPTQRESRSHRRDTELRKRRVITTGNIPRRRRRRKLEDHRLRRLPRHRLNDKAICRKETWPRVNLSPHSQKHHKFQDPTIINMKNLATRQ